MAASWEEAVISGLRLDFPRTASQRVISVPALSVPGWAGAATGLARISNHGDLYLANYKAQFSRIKAGDYRSQVEN